MRAIAAALSAVCHVVFLVTSNSARWADDEAVPKVAQEVDKACHELVNAQTKKCLS